MYGTTDEPKTLRDWAERIDGELDWPVEKDILPVFKMHNELVISRMKKRG